MQQKRGTYPDLEHRLLAGVKKVMLTAKQAGPGPWPSWVYWPCWLWTRFRDRKGYGMMSLRTNGKHRVYRVHRLAYEAFRGEKIPAGMQIDHLCCNTSCINPLHLEMVPLDVNRHRQGSRTGRKGAKARAVA